MQFNIIIVVTVLNVIGLSQATLAPFITKCRSDDAKCIRENTVVTIPLFADGIPELGVEVLDPAFFEFVNCSKLNLNFFMRNVSVMGWKKCDRVDVHRDVPNSKIYVKLSCRVESYGQYELTGRVLALDVRGKGSVHVLLRRCEVAADLPVEVIDGKDGKKHMNITNFKYTFDLVEKSDVVFENLFQGNEILSTAAAELIKNSGNEIVREIGDPMFHAAIVKVIKNINNFFRAVPMDELSLD